MTEASQSMAKLVSIEIPSNRARDLDPIWAQALADMIKVQGLLQPVRLKKIGKNGFRLVIGLHRLKAFELNEMWDIPYVLSTAETDEEERLEEVMENLGRNELNALDRCHHLAIAKDAYEAVHPDTKAGVAGGNDWVLRWNVPWTFHVLGRE